jgi:UDPglucose 6-dehydrogenase
MEPGLDAAIAQGLAAGRLRFTTSRDDALRDAEALWIAFDTPVDDDDVADTALVMREAQAMLERVPRGAIVLVSSQLPVGTVAALERFVQARRPDADLAFAAVPENLRLGKALDVFRDPDRIVTGVRDARSRERVGALLGTISSRIEWMSVESAEMTKHAINAFLALSVTFANELATLCEAVGADAKEVERGLKSESRIGPRAYLAPGGAFAGGTLARDVAFLGKIAADRGRRVPLLDAVRPSNDAHKGWTLRKLAEILPSLRGARIAVWGLTYKPGTDTLRRSAAVELCRALVREGSSVIAHDPAAVELPPDLAEVTRASDPLAAIRHAQALAVCTEWPEYRRIAPAEVANASPGLSIVDPNRFLASLAQQAGLAYYAVGTARQKVAT